MSRLRIRHVLVCTVMAFAVLQSCRTHDQDIYGGNYLTEGQVADSYMLLPPPPEESSARFQYDVEQYIRGKELRDTPRGDMAVADANVSGTGIAYAFSEAFGMEISPEHTPEIFRLIATMKEDAGDLATKHAKEKYMRPRPFMYFGEPTCLPEQQASLSTNGSYPSGHTAIGWAVALVLAEINPGRQDQILKRGYELGESRIICGYHFQSDVDAARIVAGAVVARLHADRKFSRQLKKAKKEFGKLAVGMQK